ncbi:hypothetical protein JCM3765_003538 [Sporobolomyces pararoseus]
MSLQSTPPNLFLPTPLLYVDGLTESVQDEEIVEVLSECLRLRLNLNRQNTGGNTSVAGTIEFESLHNAEKAYATANRQVFPQHSCSLSFHLSLPPSQDPVPLAQPRLIKSLPRTFTAGKVFDLCREFGPIFSATLQLAPAYPPGSGPPKFKGQALVTFYEEEDARKMTEGLHFLEVEGQSIIVALWDARRAEKGRRSDISSKSFHSNPSSPSPVQNKAERTSTWAKSTSKYPSSLSATTPEFVSPAMSRNVSGASQWSNNTGDTSFGHGGGGVGDSPKLSSKSKGDGLSIDPCNLFVKSLDPSLTSQDLYNLFSPFGQIVSARVMTDPLTSRSKEFGFVSFEEAEQADSARKEMDGKLVGSKHITVRLHEPKKLRETRLSAGGAVTEHERDGGVEDVQHTLSQLSTSDLPVASSSSTPSVDPGVVPVSGVSPSLSPESPSTTATTTLSEHERLINAVRAIKSEQTIEIVDLIEGLPKKERVMCLFNPEVLRQKVEDALLILEASKEEQEDQKQITGSTSVKGEASSSQPQILCPTSDSGDVPSSIEFLAKLPSSEIVPLLPRATLVLQLSKPTAEELESTEQFMDDLEGSPIGQIKQKLGEKLFKVIKKSDVKRAPKITIDLLDTEDLRPLSALLHYPEILKEKALLLSAASST